MDVQRKLEILADAAKYDASCASSGTEKRDSSDGKGLGSTAPGMGICHSYAPDGRCISLLKVLLTNACNYDCLYCVNRASSNVPRARFTVDEVVKLTLDFYRRNYIEGLFLSSGIIRSADYTMEQVVSVARSLREEHHFRGYIHLKTIPEADDALIAEAGKYADRLSINIEVPEENSLAKLAPEKDVRAIRRTMGRLRLKLDEAQEGRQEVTSEGKPPRFAPAGQSTQMIVGADAANDQTILDTSANLYGSYKLKRVYYSAFSPIPDSSRALPLQRAAPDARAPALSGRLADAVLRFRCRRNRREAPACCRSTSTRNSPGRCGTATASRSISPAPAARICCGCPASAPKRSTASSPPAASPRSALPISRGCISPSKGAAVHRSQRSPPLAASARRRGAGRAFQAEGGAIGFGFLR